MCINFTSQKKRPKNGQLICIVWDLVVWEHENKIWCIYILKTCMRLINPQIWLVYLWRGKRKMDWVSVICYLIKKHQTKKKSRYISLPKKILLVKAMVFPVVMYACESWTIRKAKLPRIVFELWYWRRLLIVYLTARRYNSPS